tara:strand:- start:54519 stop:56852 length:2334 start_codon:yes stop_codon:yes gene_type:complete
MTFITKAFIAIFLTIALSISTAWAADSFFVNKIKVEGLQRISLPTVMTYLPVKKDKLFEYSDSNHVIQALYKTGFFEDIQLFQQGSTLVVKVKERPTISAVTTLGNKDIPKDKLNDALKSLGLQRGEVFNRSTLAEVKQALQEQYFAMGRYNAKVTAEVNPESRNRVSVIINVSEGLIAKVMGIKIIGNKVFSESKLLDQMPISGPTLFSFISSSDQYSSQKLDAGIQALENYYMNNGYILMKVNSKQVTITPDRKAVYIIIGLTEGPQYKFTNVTLSGDLPLPAKQLRALVPIHKGDVFSREAVIQSNQILGNELGNYGYAFAQVHVTPNVDPKTRTVALDFKIDAGKKYYVRHVNFMGNPDTSNIALRNSLTQFEGGMYRANKINESVRNLRQLPYLEPAKIKVTPHKVPGSNNEVDIDAKVAEQLSAQLQFSVGYSQSYGFLAGISFSQNNFLGSGKTVGVNLTRSAYQSVYSISYTNPFFTASGISHSFSVFYQDTTPGDVNIADYATSAVGFNDSYGFPLTNYQSFNLGYGYQHTHLRLGDTPSKEMTNFVKDHGSYFNQFLLTGGWNFSTLDQSILPNSGTKQSLSLSVSLPVGSTALDYYTAQYQNRFYQPVGGGFIFTTYAIAGYGDGYGRFNGLPFFENYFAGGLGVPGQNRGFEPNALGPRDSNNNSIGGNLLLSGSLGVILPSFITPKIRTELFMDAGNVFDTNESVTNPQYERRLQLSNVRYSAGVQVEWWTPLGMPLIFSVAEPIGPTGGADTQIFQFTIGGTF